MQSNFPLYCNQYHTSSTCMARRCHHHFRNQCNSHSVITASPYCTLLYLVVPLFFFNEGNTASPSKFSQAPPSSPSSRFSLRKKKKQPATPAPAPEANPAPAASLLASPPRQSSLEQAGVAAAESTCGNCPGHPPSSHTPPPIPPPRLF